MSKLLAALISTSLMIAGVNVYAEDTMMKKEGMSTPAMDKGMKEGMSSPMAMDAPKKSSVKKKKRHHKHKMKKHAAMNGNKGARA